MQFSLRLAFNIEVKIDFSLDLSFLDQTTPTPQSLVRPLSDSDLATARSTVIYLLGLDLRYLSTNHKDVFCVTLEVLALASKVPQSKIFISKALAQTSSTFHALDRALKSKTEISSKLDTLKT